ncbi:alpha/beta hydrolase [Xanthomonadaceae bacterium JHOS43]|nr:alpha/beta hydrolase [Xanthomonadaceae bacterium JHOS43]
MVAQVSPPTLQHSGPLALDRFIGHTQSSAQPQPALLFAHGFGQTRLAWARAAQRLAAQGFPGISFDARGHGGSRWNAPEEDYAFDQFVDDMTRLARAQETPPILIGASMGGLLGMYAQGHRDPPPFHALVLVDITPRWDAAGVERILGFMTAHPEGFEDLEHAADAIARYLPHRAQRKSSRELEKLLVQQPNGRWRWHWDPRLIDSVGRRGEEYQARLLDAAQRITVPTLLISGGRSDLVNDDHVAEFLALVPHARHVRLPEATHMVAGDDNDAFTRTILDFLVTLPTATSFPPE